MKTHAITDMQRRGQAYWYEDGLWEAVIGIVFVVYAAYYGVVGLLPEGSTAAAIMSMGYIVFVPGVMFGGSRVVRVLKSRITAPRTGHVVVRGRGRSRVRTVVVALVVAAAAAAGALWVDRLYVPALIGGVGLSVGLLVTARRFALPRMAAVGTVALLTALVVSFMTDDPELAFSLLFGVVGIATAASGGIALTRYLRAHPSAPSDDDSDQGGR